MVVSEVQIGREMPAPRSNRYPFRRMNVGESFVVNLENREKRPSLHLVVKAASIAGKRHNMKFSSRILDERTIGIWRIS